jgi:hypothetical protein
VTAHPGDYVHDVVASETHHPDGSVDTEARPAVWTLARRGYSGGGRLDIWVYLDREEALRAGAELVLEYGLDDDPEAVRLFHAGEHEKLLSYYEQVHGDRHLFRVQPAWLQATGGPDRRRRR